MVCYFNLNGHYRFNILHYFFYQQKFLKYCAIKFRSKDFLKKCVRVLGIENNTKYGIIHNFFQNLTYHKIALFFIKIEPLSHLLLVIMIMRCIDSFKIILPMHYG